MPEAKAPVLEPAARKLAEADVLRDEGEAYADHLRAAAVPVTAVRYAAILHDFVMLDALHGTQAEEAAITQAITFITAAQTAGRPTRKDT